MKQLTVELKNEKQLGYYGVFIDGKSAEFTRDEKGKLVCKSQTEKESVKIEAVRYLNCGGVAWFITQILLFIVSIFGLFDVKEKNRHIALEFSAELETADFGYVALNFNALKEGERAVEISANTPAKENANSYYADETAKSVFKKLFIAKIITAIAVVAAVVTAVVLAVVL